MCEIFPEVEHFFLCCSVRIGMIYIAILAIMTGCFFLILIEKQAGASLNMIQKPVQHVFQQKKAGNMLNKLKKEKHAVVSAGISFVSVLFMFAGVMLLGGNLFDYEGLVQIFVWVTFVAVIIAMFMVVGVAEECLLSEPISKNCILKEVIEDWLIQAATLFGICFYLILWIYFISVANTYVLGVFKP